MKLIVTICAYNEAETIKDVVLSIPKSIPGISQIQTIVVDDGSQDATAKVAIDAGVTQVLQNKKNIGLAQSYKRALECALQMGADILVHTDADNQYDQSQIVNILKPILENKADLVVGNRQVQTKQHMSWSKKYGNLVGSRVVNLLMQTNGIDVSSGFRAMTRDVALQLTSFYGHTYTHQTLIEAVHKNMNIQSVPVLFRERKNGDSRLIGGVVSHIRTSIFVIIRTMLVYYPLKTFIALGSVFALGGFVLGVRFVYYFFFEIGSGKVQSLILAAVLLIFGLVLWSIGFLGDVIAANRRLLDELLYRQKKQFFDN